MPETASRIAQLPARELRALAERLKQKKRGEGAAETAPDVGGPGRAGAEAQGEPVPEIRPAPRLEPAGLPLSFAQERLWFLDRLQPGTASYNMPVAFRLAGRLDPGALAASLDAVVARHEALRTTFEAVGGRPVQRVAPPEAVRLGPPVVDLAGLPEERREGAALALAAREAARLFDLERGPLVRAVLLRLAAERHIALFTMHHAVSDGWSLGILVRELGELYSAARSGRAPSPRSLAPLPVQYADFAVWQRAWLSGEVLARQLAFWRTALAGAPAVLDLPLDRPRPAIQSLRGAHLTLGLPPDLARSLAELARAGGATLFMVLLAGFGALLARLSGQPDVVIGTPVANRSRVEVEGLIGLFVNTLALRAGLPAGAGFAGLLARVRETTLAAYAHQDLPFERLVEELQPERSLSHSPLFQVMFILQNAPVGTLELPGLTLEPLDHIGDEPPASAKFDLTLSVGEVPGGLVASWEYDAGLFDAATVARMAGQLERLLAAAVAELERRVEELPLLGEAERQQILEWNVTAEMSAWAPALAHERFAAQAGERPDAVALVCGEERLSYGELARRAELLARRLRSLGVEVEQRVGICVQRTLEMVVAVLAVLEAGGAYVPLDPGYPRERLRFMAADAGLALVLAGPGAPGDLEIDAPVVRLDGRGAAENEKKESGWGALRWHPAAEVDAAAGGQVAVAAGNLAYVLYTSGSTGRPKGVAIEHRSVAALLAWVGERFGTGPLAGSLDSVLASTSLAFDLSVFEILGPLSWGGKVVLVPDALHLPALAAEVTLVNTVPSAMAELSRVRGLPASVRVVGLAGEPLPGSLAAELYAAGVDHVLNLYGPSEDTTYSTASEVPWGEASPAIGRPIDGTRVHLLDEALRPVPVGVVGELCLAGAGLARGYLGRPDLTAECFVPDPFATGGQEGARGEADGVPEGARLYRTGDLARYRPSGEIELVGRRDRQVKLRGFRIEMGEIEAALSRHPAVREAAVVVRAGRSGERELVAFAVPRADGGPATGELRSWLAGLLPAYMVPAEVNLLDALPLTPNGKVDRRALAERGARNAGGAGGRPAPVPPRDALELALVRMWEELLGVTPVGAGDNFFDLGGHSLLAVRLLSRVESELGQALPLPAIFQAPTVERLAALLRSRAGAAPAFSPLVLLAPGDGSRRPFFCVHPVGGSVFCYRELARHLPPFYALQARGLVGEPHGSIGEMASFYLEAVRAAQPAGPYLLGGWSFGALVAFEMARQLAERGEPIGTVERLVLIEPTPPMGAKEEADEVAPLLLLARDLEGLTGRRLDLGEADLRPLDPDRRLDLVLERARQAGGLPPDAGPAGVRSLARLYQANLEAALDYAPLPGPAPVLFIEAFLEALTEAPDPARLAAQEASRRERREAWASLAAGGMELRELPGDHYSLLREPAVRRLAETLRGLLDGAR